MTDISDMADASDQTPLPITPLRPTFLTLPPEITRKIYDEVLHESSVTLRIDDKRTTPWHRSAHEDHVTLSRPLHVVDVSKSQQPVLLTCQKVKDEAQTSHEGTHALLIGCNAPGWAVEGYLALNNPKLLNSLRKMRCYTIWPLFDDLQWKEGCETFFSYFKNVNDISLLIDMRGYTWRCLSWQLWYMDSRRTEQQLFQRHFTEPSTEMAAARLLNTRELLAEHAKHHLSLVIEKTRTSYPDVKIDTALNAATPESAEQTKNACFRKYVSSAPYLNLPS